MVCWSVRVGFTTTIRMGPLFTLTEDEAHEALNILVESIGVAGEA